jgi:hypothetical protein
MHRVAFIKPDRTPVPQPTTVIRGGHNKKTQDVPIKQRMSPDEKRARVERIRQHQAIANQRKEDAKRAASNPNFNPYKYGSIESVWKNETVYIVAGGSSLSGFDFNRLKGKKVIAINKAFAYLPFADYLYWTDTRFYLWYKSEIDKLACKKVTASTNPKDLTEDVILLRNSGSRIIDMANDRLTAGNNSGFGALNLALKLGASKIYLLGYDMKYTNNKAHFHDGYPSASNNREHIYAGMIRYFEDNAHLINAMAEVYNTNPNSSLTCFKFCSLDGALSS